MSVALRLIGEAAAQAIVAGGCPSGVECAHDFPADGDRVAANMYLQRLESRFDPGPFGIFLVLLAGDDGSSEVVIGGAGFHGAPDEDGRVEVGYGIVPSMRAKGYATRALELLIETARRQGATTLSATTDPGNSASQSVLSRCAFTRSGSDDHALHFELPLAAS